MLLLVVALWAVLVAGRASARLTPRAPPRSSLHTASDNSNNGPGGGTNNSTSGTVGVEFFERSAVVSAAVDVQAPRPAGTKTLEDSNLTWAAATGVDAATARVSFGRQDTALYSLPSGGWWPAAGRGGIAHTPSCRCQPHSLPSVEPTGLGPGLLTPLSEHDGSATAVLRCGAMLCVL